MRLVASPQRVLGGERYPRLLHSVQMTNSVAVVESLQRLRMVGGIHVQESNFGSQRIQRVKPARCLC